MLVAIPKEQQNLIANSIVGQKLSVHETEKIVKKFKEEAKNTHNSKSSSKIFLSNGLNHRSVAKLKNICQLLDSQSIKANFLKNKLIVEFSNDEEVEKFSKILPNHTF